MSRYKPKKERPAVTRTEIWIIIGVATLLSVPIFIFHAPSRWFAAIYCTVVCFGGMISYFRKQWQSIEFWMIVAAEFTLHLVLIAWIFGRILRAYADISLAVCIPFIFAECSLLYYGLLFVERLASWRTSRARPLC